MKKVRWRARRIRTCRYRDNTERSNREGQPNCCRCHVPRIEGCRLYSSPGEPPCRSNWRNSIELPPQTNSRCMSRMNPGRGCFLAGPSPRRVRDPMIRYRRCCHGNKARGIGWVWRSSPTSRRRRLAQSEFRCCRLSPRQSTRCKAPVLRRHRNCRHRPRF
jgi:hypothetical protein